MIKLGKYRLISQQITEVWRIEKEKKKVCGPRRTYKTDLYERYLLGEIEWERSEDEFGGVLDLDSTQILNNNRKKNSNKVAT